MLVDMLTLRYNLPMLNLPLAKLVDLPGILPLLLTASRIRIRDRDSFSSHSISCQMLFFN